MSVGVRAVAAMMMVVFWCHLMNDCPVVLNPFPGGGSTVRSNAAERDSFQNILLLFNVSNRYLCIDHRGRVYSRRRVSIVIISPCLTTTLAPGR